MMHFRGGDTVTNETIIGLGFLSVGHFQVLSLTVTVTVTVTEMETGYHGPPIMVTSRAVQRQLFWPSASPYVTLFILSGNQLFC